MTIEQLLKWARENRLFIQIYCDGTTFIEVENSWGMHEFLVDGYTLREALEEAMKRIGSNQLT